MKPRIFLLICRCSVCLRLGLKSRVKLSLVLAKDYLSRAGSDLVKEIQNHVKRITAPYKYPRIIEFVKELPKTISGKIRHVAIRQADAVTAKAAKG